ncbi:MAG: Pr6Pr family membrane protein [Chloroflexi bacterium]|nr:Pr6Pr family membrane protein [Chloroflexota bacterium]
MLALIALAAQLMQSIGAQRSTVDFFSYFTIQSNLIAVGVLLWVALKPVKGPGPLSRDLIRGAPVLYLTITGVVFFLLLSDLPLVTVPFANTVLHKLMPVVMVADWLIDPPSEALSFRQATAWLIYPLAWLGYTMLRGPLVGWYPYPFLNPAVAGGYGAVLFSILLILLGGLFFIWLLVWLGRKARQWISKPSAVDYAD